MKNIAKVHIIQTQNTVDGRTTFHYPSDNFGFSDSLICRNPSTRSCWKRQCNSCSGIWCRWQLLWTSKCLEKACGCSGTWCEGKSSTTRNNWYICHVAWNRDCREQRYPHFAKYTWRCNINGDMAPAAATTLSLTYDSFLTALGFQPIWDSLIQQSPVLYGERLRQQLTWPLPDIFRSRESASLTLGNMLEAFLSPQPEIVSRNFFHLNRSFCTKVPTHQPLQMHFFNV